MISLQGLFTNADGSPAKGTICLFPVDPFDPTATVSPVCGELDDQGRIVSQRFEALEVTESTTVAYTIELSLFGQPLVEFPAYISVGTVEDPAAQATVGSAVVTLGQLIAAESMIGQAISGSLASGTVTAIDVVANTVTVSAPATGTGTFTATLAGCAYSSLEPL